jgi:hypothetical protein
MSLRQRIVLLRKRATHLREIAALDPNSPLNPVLVDMAATFDKRASDLEQRHSAGDQEPASLEPAQGRPGCG